MPIIILQNNQQTIQAASTLTAGTGSAVVSTVRAKGYCVEAQVTVNTPAAQAFTADHTTSIFTATAHGMYVGLVVQVSNAGGALPTGLSGATNYYVTNVTANTFQLATTAANAAAGTNLTISSNGTGTQTVTPTALASATASLYASIDGVQPYVQVASSSQNITATVNLMWNVVDPMYESVKVVYTMASGQISSVQNILVKGI